MKPNDHTDNQDLRAFLEEDLDSTDRVDDYLPIINKLQQWSAPTSTQAMTNALIAQLENEMPTSQSIWERLSQEYPIMILRSQLMVVRQEIWIASVLMTIIGLLVTFTFYDSASGTLTPIAILAPVIGAIGTGLIYDSDLERVLELESATRTSKHIILLARLTLVYGFNLILSLMASVILATTLSDLSLLPLVTSWFVPMTFLSALAFFISIISGDAFLGWSINIGIWALHVFFNTQVDETTLFAQLLALQGLSTPQFHPLLLTMAIILVAVAIWFTERVERVAGDFA